MLHNICPIEHSHVHFYDTPYQQNFSFITEEEKKKLKDSILEQVRQNQLYQEYNIGSSTIVLGFNETELEQAYLLISHASTDIIDSVNHILKQYGIKIHFLFSYPEKFEGLPPFFSWEDVQNSLNSTNNLKICHKMKSILGL